MFHELRVSPLEMKEILCKEIGAVFKNRNVRTRKMSKAGFISIKQRRIQEKGQ